jgi:hypothetical protein
VKWRNWKLAFFEPQRDWWSPPVKLGTPQLFDLITDPKEEHPQISVRQSWAVTPCVRIVAQFMASLQREAPIEPGTPDPYTPEPPSREPPPRARRFIEAAGEAIASIRRD